MGIYITEIVKKNEKQYGFYEGPKINASSWEDAINKAERQGVTLIGELAS